MLWIKHIYQTSCAEVLVDRLFGHPGDWILQACLPIPSRKQAKPDPFG